MGYPFLEYRLIWLFIISVKHYFHTNLQQNWYKHNVSGSSCAFPDLNQPFLHSLVCLSGKWYLETKLYTLSMFMTGGISLSRFLELEKNGNFLWFNNKQTRKQIMYVGILVHDADEEDPELTSLQIHMEPTATWRKIPSARTPKVAQQLVHTGLTRKKITSKWGDVAHYTANLTQGTTTNN